MRPLDERLHHDLKHLSEPVDEDRAFEGVARRRGRRHAIRRLEVGALAVAVLVGSVLGTLGLLRAFRDVEPDPARPAPPPVTPAFDDLPPGWTDLPPPPEVRSGAATAWTGDRLIIWGGFVYSGLSDEEAEGDGFAFDARTMAWEPIAPSPLTARAHAASAWTGTEMLVWGGGDRYAPGVYGDGAAYDPGSDAWRQLPPAPITPRVPLSVWTGEEFILWGTAARVDERPRDGAAYDPATNTWRKIAEAPIELTDATAVWTGEEMIVFGAALHGGNVPETNTAIGAAYDPRTDTWRRIPDSKLSPQASTAAWNGRELVGWDYEHATAVYDPQSDRWRALADVPLDDFECSPQAVAVDAYVFGEYCGLMALHDRDAGEWRDISRPRLAGWGFRLVVADPVVLVLGENLDQEQEAMLAYRPPASRSDAASARRAVIWTTTAFLERRAADSGAERYLTEEGIADYASDEGTLWELYAPPPIRFGSGSIVFVDGPLDPDGSYEVGIRIPRFNEGERVGPLEETLFVQPSTSGDGFVITGGRPGLEGP